jgi:alkylation response protein AidB-like acyl-CoA dehydrogenase
MDWRHAAESEAFRLEFRNWLEANVPDNVRGLHSGLNLGEAKAQRAWNAQLADAGYAAVGWPKEYGGRDAGPIEQMIVVEELDRIGAPGPVNVIGNANIAPSIMHWGTDEQKARFLRPMLRGDEIWSQGFSEPDAGSDLAGLRTSAVQDGDEFIINGQKIWNSLGSHADWCELLVRTDPSAQKHAGISCLIVKLSLPGVEVRPIITITGESEFAEIFFDNVRVPKSALLGPLNAGWQVAMTTLAYERAGVASLHLQARRHLMDMIEAARGTTRDDRPVTEDPLVRQSLAKCYLQAEHLRFLADRAIARDAKGLEPGPEGSLVKLAWSSAEKHIAEISSRVLGAVANTESWGQNRLSSLSSSIAGGTTQVNKNIVARRVLGLPKPN